MNCPHRSSMEGRFYVQCIPASSCPRAYGKGWPMAMDSLKFHSGPPCPTFLRPVSRFRGDFGRLLPLWTPHAARPWPRPPARTSSRVMTALIHVHDLDADHESQSAQTSQFKAKPSRASPSNPLAIRGCHSPLPPYSGPYLARWLRWPIGWLCQGT
jgi:hypothetical protein